MSATNPENEHTVVSHSDDLEIESLVQREKELFLSQQDTAIYAFDTVLNTIVKNQNRILSLEHAIFDSQKEIIYLRDIIDSLEDELSTQHKAWRRSLHSKEIELKKYQIQLEKIVPELFRSREEKIIDLEHKIELLEEIIRCKDRIIASSAYN